MWKKVLGVLAVIAVGAGLALWGAGPKTIATTDDGNVTESKYYKELKQTPTGQQTLANMIVLQVLDKEYGDKVSDKDVNKKFNESRKQMGGEQFNQQLAASGLTAQTYRDSIKIDMLERQAVKANTDFSKSGLHKIYDDYEPKTSASVILMGSKSDAQKIIKELNDGKSFTDLAKKYSGDSSSKKNGGKLDDFDSTDTKVDSNVKKAAFKLKNGQYDKQPVQAANNTGYYVVKRNTQEKKPSYDKMKNKLKDIKVDEIMSDDDQVNAVIGKELGKANVNIKDKDLKNVLNKYTEAAATKTADKEKNK
ncbi:foldase protein PrsA [Weissella uvarum]|uniref:peptidylprolyl isomerase n=1 Tax=Weissella uvarum TaxID=1479233 RepID=UPI00195FCBDC|nr:peptidylprolyl isomerase [Weissella uvarum]MBM7617208.1 foldase protein PrsA [Weissella uvarum]MCM0595501.1 peptidylprolyl isomerase [Weissella uvarum]